MAIGCTPRELLARVTVDDIREAMAFERLEPFGSLHLEAVVGQVCATLANIDRDPEKRREPFQARDFMPALDRAFDNAGRADEPLFIDDPVAMSNLIRARIFKMPEAANGR